MRTFENDMPAAARPGRSAVMAAPALARSSAVLFWMLLLIVGLATGFLLAQSVKYLLGW